MIIILFCLAMFYKIDFHLKIKNDYIYSDIIYMSATSKSIPSAMKIHSRNFGLSIRGLNFSPQGFDFHMQHMHA